MSTNGDDVHVGTTVDRETKSFIEGEAERIGITEAELHRRLVELYRVSRQRTLACPHCDGALEFDLSIPDDESELSEVIEYAPMESTGLAGTEVNLPHTGVVTVEGALALHDEAIHDPEPFGIASLLRLRELEEEVEELREEIT